MLISPPLWLAHSDTQMYLTGLLTKPTGRGPAVTACVFLPDKDCFSARGAKDVVPIYRDADRREANTLPGLLDILGKTYARAVTPEELFAYVYGILAQPAFTDRYAEELGTRELRVPLTKIASLFARVCDVGAKLLWLHTYAQRYVPTKHHRGQVPKGQARCTKPVSGDATSYPERYEYNDAARVLYVGDGEFSPVPPKVYEYEVSGLKVVQSWLKYRMKSGGAKKSSPLDNIRPTTWTRDFTTELLELLWILEATISEYPSQAKLFAEVVRRPCFSADGLPAVPDWARKAPSRCASEDLFGAEEGDDE
jgi:predicted helicase